jgi:hypothetical protein
VPLPARSEQAQDLVAIRQDLAHTVMRVVGSRHGDRERIWVARAAQNLSRVPADSAPSEPIAASSGTVRPTC